jgi:hypothetical protein
MGDDRCDVDPAAVNHIDDQVGKLVELFTLQNEILSNLIEQVQSLGEEVVKLRDPSETTVPAAD